MNGNEPKPKGKPKSAASMVSSVVAAMTDEQRAAIDANDAPATIATGSPAAGAVTSSSPVPVATPGDQPPAPATAPNADAQPAAPAAQPAPPVAAAPAAAAQPAADPWAEYEELTYQDGDTGESYTVRAPKTYADKVKNGYARRSIMDRHSSYLGQHKQWLEPVATSGQLDGVAPIIQAALNDKEYADAMVQALNRRRMGLPMFDTPQQAAAATPAQQQAAAAVQQGNIPDPIAEIDADPELDEWTKGVLKRRLAPFAQAFERVNKLEQSFNEQRQQMDAQAQQARQAAEQRARDEQTGIAARNALVRQFPETYGNAPQETFQRVLNYGNQSGIFQQYGFGPASVILAHQAMNNPMGMHGLGRPAAASTAAATVAEAAARGVQLANAAAAQVAPATTPTGAPAPQAQPDVKPRLIRHRTDAAGRKYPVSAKDIANQMAAKGMI